MGSTTLDKLIKKAEAGDTYSMQQLATRYLNGSRITPQDFSKALHWFTLLAEEGNAVAAFNTGLFYAKGAGTPRDFEKAEYWMRKAAELGDEDGEKEAEKYMMLASALKKAQDGDAKMQGILARGLMELGGSLEQAGAGKDYQESVLWAKRAAEQNDSTGCEILGLAYEKGRGVEADYNEAAKLYQQGANLGNTVCMNNLALLYMNGEGVSKDEKRGLELLTSSAENGYTMAMLNLGLYYQRKNGGQEDLSMAIKWLKKANEELQLRQLTLLIDSLRQLRGILLDKTDTSTGSEGFSIKDGKLIKYRGKDKKVKIPTGLTEISGHAFSLNNNLESIEITPDVRVIGENAFIGCHSLHDVIFPETLEKIDYFAFANCDCIEKIDLPESLTEIGECAFTNCTGLRHVSIPNGVKTIGNGAFLDCENLESVVLPEGLTCIENEAFAHCFSLKSINIPSTVKNIGKDAFLGCMQLQQDE